MRKEFVLVDPYEHELHTYLWETSEPLKGVVQIVHGAGEHMGRYDHFANYLNSIGFNVIGNDHLGHGKTAKTLEYVYFDSTIGFHKVYEGVKTVRDYIQENYPKQPVIMFAHSMGSFIGRYAILYDHKRYDQALFSGTGQFNRISIFLGKLLANIIIRFKGDKYVSEFFNHKFLDGHIRSMKRNGLINKRIEWISQDRKVQKEWLDDEYSGIPFSIGAQKDILSFIPEVQDKQRIKKSASSTAIYFVSGDLDGLGKYGLVAKRLFNSYNDCGYSNVKYSVLNNTRHEIINALEKDSHYQLIGDWMLRNI